MSRQAFLVAADRFSTPAANDYLKEFSMPGFQFIHLEAYGFARPKRAIQTTKKRGRKPEQKLIIQEVIDEARRVEGNCPHIAEPVPPEEIVSVIPLKDLMREIERRRDLSVDPLGRKIRKDALALLAGVSSFPVRCADLETEAQWEDVGRFFRETIAFLQKKFEQALVNVTVHLDEEFPHCHFYCIPEAGKGSFNMVFLHPGITAKENAAPAKKGGSKEDRIKRDQAYVKAMQQFQDDYYDEVAVYFGMGRTGPSRERLSRDEWLARQRENERHAFEASRLKEMLKESEEKRREAEEKAARLEALLERLED